MKNLKTQLIQLTGALVNKDSKIFRQKNAQILSVFTCFYIAISLLKYMLINLLFTLLIALFSPSTEPVKLNSLCVFFCFFYC